MLRIGLIKEGKIPADNRVALTPAQCKKMHRELKWLLNLPGADVFQIKNICWLV
jgi:hypothetical protein